MSDRTNGHTASERLQEKLAELIPLRHYFVTGYSRNGLFLLLKAMEWDSTSEVIVPAFTCTVIRHTVEAAGLVPVPVDAEDDGINIDPEKIAAAITVRTKAIYVVHTYGMAAQIDAICATARKHGCIVIEDLAHAPFAMYKGKPLGTYGDYAVLSFTKKIINYEGGAIGTNNPAVFAKMEKLRQEYDNNRSFSLSSIIDGFVRLVGSWWESSFSPAALLLMKINDLVNTVLFKGSYGIAINSADFLPRERGCAITLRQIEGLHRQYHGNSAVFHDRAAGIKGVTSHPPRNGSETGPFYYTGIPTGRKRMFRLVSFRTWHNSNEPGRYPRADYLYDNLRIFSRAVLLFPRMKGPLDPDQSVDSIKVDSKQRQFTYTQGGSNETHSRSYCQNSDAGRHQAGAHYLQG